MKMSGCLGVLRVSGFGACGALCSGLLWVNAVLAQSQVKREKFLKVGTSGKNTRLFQGTS